MKVSAVWMVLIILGLLASSKLSEHLTTSLAVPGSESAKADQLLATHFNENIEGTFTIILTFPESGKAEIENLKTRIALAASTIPSARVRGYGS